MKADTMEQASGTPTTDPVTEREQSASLRRLMQQVRQSSNLTEALCAGRTNLSHLMSCCGAALSLSGQIDCVDSEYLPLAQSVLDELPDRHGHHLFFTNQWRPTGTSPLHARCRAVLAVRFHPADAGWLFWFRLNDAGSEATARWSEGDISMAGQLREQLMEVFLERASDTVTSQRQLIATLGHSLFNPLQAISMSAMLLSQSSVRNLELRKNIAASSQNMEKLVKQAMDVNRIQTGEGVAISPTQSNVTDLLKSILSAAQQRNPALDIRASLQEDLQAVIDPDRYAQAVRTFLGLAKSHREPDGPIEVILAEDEGSIELALTMKTSQANAEEIEFVLTSPVLAKPSSPASGAAGQEMNALIARSVASAHDGELSWYREQDTLTIHFSVPGMEPAQ